jgi:MFS family permease
VKRWRALMVLGTAQFLMVLDTSVMNVSITQLVEDFDTEVTAIQAVITLYALVMAAFMLIGGRFGDVLGRDQVRSAAEQAGVPPSEVDAVVDSYASAQLDGLKASILTTGGIALAIFPVTRHLPTSPAGRSRRPGAGAAAGTSGSAH